MKKLILSLLLSLPLLADQRSVVWDKNPEPDVVSYILKYGRTEGDMATITTDKTSVVVDLTPGKWLFQVYAVNDEGAKSEPSDLVAYTVVKPAPSKPKGLKVIEIKLEGSNDKIKWKEIASAYPEKKWKYVRIKS